MRGSAALLVVFAAAAVSLPAAGQAPDTRLHFTLESWADYTWLRILDRDGAAHGRLSDRGILQRFNRTTDDEYVLDLVSGRFTLTEDYEWHQRSNGFRYWAGSINKRDLVAFGEIKVGTSLGSGWRVGAKYDKEESPSADRSLLRVEFTRGWNSGISAMLQGTLVNDKSQADIELGLRYRQPGGVGPDVALMIGLLDTFNDVIYQNIGVWSGFADTAIDFEGRPVTFRARADLPLGRRLRFEAHAAYMTPYGLRAYEQLAPENGFRQREKFGYFGSMLELQIGPGAAAGAFGNYVGTSLDRTPIVTGETDDFALIETDAQLGAVILGHMARRWGVEAWLARHWRTERKTLQSPTLADIDYEDHGWVGRALASYQPGTGPQFGLALDVDLRDVIRGADQLPTALLIGGNDTRASGYVGWRLRNAGLWFGLSYDLDGDSNLTRTSSWFDGIRARFYFNW